MELLNKINMYDAHYDLLTILYFRMKQENKYYDINKLCNDLRKIYRHDNVKGGIINLYFMSKKEMEDELDIKEEEYLNVPKMFEESINNLLDLKNLSIISQDTDFMCSIEGCDYLKDPQELEELYAMGLRFIVPVWNEKNKYGCGVRGESGLTELGKDLLSKAIDLGIGIDISHANQKTSNDILDFVIEARKNGKNPFVLASHSNVKNLCNNSRNLSDEILLKLKEAQGYIGVLVHGGFLTKKNEELSIDERKPYLFNHLDYLINKIKFPQDKIMISTDNMNFNPDEEYHNLEAFRIDNIAEELREFLASRYDYNFVEKIMFKNMQNLFQNIRNFEKVEKFKTIVK